MERRILVVDDEPSVRFGLRDFLSARGYEVEAVDCCAAAEEAFFSSHPDAVIIDYVLPDGNALDLLPRLKNIEPSIPIIVLTAHGSIDLAVRAVKEGAEHFLTKPLELSALHLLLERLFENQRNRKKQLVRESREARDCPDPFLGTSAAIRELAEHAKKVVHTDAPVLVQGATGTGKTLLATWLHNNSSRHAEPFVDLNCSSLSRELLEAELFGFEKGAFTGAVNRKPGLLEVAQRGTVFLDEIGDLHPEVQPKLLKVLEDRKFRRLGGVQDRRVDIRLIFATHQDLSQLVLEKKVRADLYYRINMMPLTVPALRQRIEDIPILARDLLQRFAKEIGRRDVELSKEVEIALQEYRWPGNIRELRNVLERALLLTDKRILTRKDLKFETPATTHSLENESNLTLLELERKHIQSVLREEHGRVEQAAIRLGIPRSSLYQKIKKHQITLSEF